MTKCTVCKNDNPEKNVACEYCHATLSNETKFIMALELMEEDDDLFDLFTERMGVPCFMISYRERKAHMADFLDIRVI